MESIYKKKYFKYKKKYLDLKGGFLKWLFKNRIGIEQHFTGIVSDANTTNTTLPNTKRMKPYMPVQSQYNKIITYINKRIENTTMYYVHTYKKDTYATDKILGDIKLQNCHKETFWLKTNITISGISVTIRLKIVSYNIYYMLDYDATHVTEQNKVIFDDYINMYVSFIRSIFHIDYTGKNYTVQKCNTLEDYIKC